ncbi:MAG: CBS domain-containing protein [Pseudomonadota bacterium]
MAIIVHGPGVSDPVPLGPPKGDKPAPTDAISPVQPVRDEEKGSGSYAAERLRAAISAAGERQGAATRALRAGTLMSESLFTLVVSMSLAEARHELHARGLEHAPVVDAFGRLVGLLEQGDLLGMVWPPDGLPTLAAQVVTVGEACRKPVTALRVDTPFEAIVRLMLDEGHAALAVEDGDGVVIGMVTQQDLLRGVLRVARLEAWA